MAKNKGAGLIRQDFSTQLRSWLAWFTGLVVVGGMAFSPYVQSIGLFGVVFVALLPDEWAAGWPQRYRARWRTDWREFWRRPDFWVVLAFALVVFIGIWAVEDPAYLRTRMRIKAPFLFLPLAFFSFPFLPRRWIENWWLAVLVVLSIGCAGIIGNYLLHQEAIHAAMLAGSPMPMPTNHIRFSLLVALATVVGLHLGRTAESRRGWFWGLSLGLFVALHILSVRSGLASLYAALVVYAGYVAWERRRWGVALAGVVLVVTLPVVAFFTVPSFETKMRYAYYDFEQYRRGEDLGLLSDASRWVSLRAGWELFERNRWVGVGAANLKQELEAIYDRDYPGIEQKIIPSNQWAYTLAATGLLGVTLLAGGFFYPLLYRRNYQRAPLLLFYVIAGASFLVEATLETAMGVAFFGFFLLFLLKYAAK